MTRRPGESETPANLKEGNEAKPDVRDLEQREKRAKGNKHSQQK